MVYRSKIKIALSLCIGLIILGAVNADAQQTNTATQIGSIDAGLDFSGLAVRSVPLSQEHDQAYTALLSKLYAERLRLLDSSNKLRATMKQLDASGKSEMESEVKMLDSKISKMNQDIDILNMAFEKNTTNEQMEYVLKVITRSQFPSEVDNKDEVVNWDSEFSYIEKENLAYQVDQSIYDDCQIVFNGIDPNTLQQKVQTSNENLISYTHPKLESYYQDQSFLTGDVSLVKLGKDKYVVLDIVIRSRDAIKNYGMIQVGSPLKVELMNGESAYLFASANAEGRPIPQTSQVRYQVLYFANKTEYKQLQSSEVDNVGIMWTSGYEKYDVYNLDVLQRQISCIESY